MKKTIFISLCLITQISYAQSPFKDICNNPSLAAGKYMAYQQPEEKIAEAPKGYKPFYISTFARHGSRYLTKKNKYDNPIEILSKANALGKLSNDGINALNVITKLSEEADGRYGELTPKGFEQHRNLVRRMYSNYPEIFKGKTHIDARSTYKTRAFLSMAAACIELKGLNPKLDISIDASQHDEYYLKYKNKKYESLHTTNKDSVYHIADSIYIKPERMMMQIFNDSIYVKDSIGNQSKQLMNDLFELNGISQSSYDQQDLAFLFTKEELYDLWQRNNFEWYYEKGPSPLSGNCMFYLEKNLLQNIVETADSIIRLNKTYASLRYGHDTNLAPLAVLMGLNQLRYSTEDWYKIADTYQTYNIIPMCGNIQLIFFRKKGSDDILVKIMLNEKEAILPLESDISPFYHWQDVKRYWTDVTSHITLPE